MAHTVLVHMSNEDPVLAEMDELPGAQDQFITLQNPRRRDGKDLHYILVDVTTSFGRSPALVLLRYCRVKRKRMS